MNVLVLGGSGFVGNHLIAALRRRGDDVRAASVRVPGEAARIAATCDAVVNLAGEPLAQRWTPAVKQRIVTSRTEAPAHLLDALAPLTRSTRVYVSASAVGYYGTSESATFTEESPPGDDFLARVCTGWEATAARATELGLRVAIVRSGIALGTDGGALAKMLPPFRLGAGGPVGSGRQWWSWIHIDDLVAIYCLALDGLEGPVNGTAPAPVTNAEFTHALGRQLHRPAAMPVPAFVLRAALGEGAEALLTGQRVLPERALARGFQFAFPKLDDALANLLPMKAAS